MTPTIAREESSEEESSEDDSDVESFDGAESSAPTISKETREELFAKIRARLAVRN